MHDYRDIIKTTFKETPLKTWIGDDLLIRVNYWAKTFELEPLTLKQCRRLVSSLRSEGFPVHLMNPGYQYDPERKVQMQAPRGRSSRKRVFNKTEEVLVKDPSQFQLIVEIEDLLVFKSSTRTLIVKSWIEQ